ncbi:hypothetical protein BGW41_007188 [Actinomortierella wolfii]|nr:hypothetical protein BGW41_007188 [Actinomortierella wolfii]
MPPISPETQSSAHESGKHTPQPEIATWESEHKTDAKTKNVPTGLLDHLDSDQQHNTQCRSTDDAHKSSPPPPDAKMSGSMNEEWVARGGNAPKSPDTPSYSTHNAFESLDQCLSAKNKQSPPPLISLSRSGSDPPNSLKNHSVNLKFLPRASWCPEHDPRSDLLHHHHDVEDLTVDMQRMKITECPWPEKYSRYMYFNADNQQVPWTGAHDNQGKLIPVADDAEDLNYFLQAYPNGRRIIIPGPIRANTSSRLDEVLFLLGGHKLVGVVNEQKADRRSVPLEIRRVLENGTLADADLVPIDHATSGKGDVAQERYSNCLIF